MKKMLLGTVFVSTLGMAGGPAFAGSYGAMATVLESRPVYERVSTPTEQCWVEQVTRYENRPVAQEYPSGYDDPASAAPAAVLGAIVGGVIGHQFGGSSGGRDRATAAGALLGGLVGYGAGRGYAGGTPYASRVATERVPVTQDVRRCRTVSESSDRVVGYDVRYLYEGREFTTRMATDPGPTLQVSVNVSPDGTPYAAAAPYPAGGVQPYRYGPGPVAPVYSRAGY